MKLRFKVDQAECFLNGIDCPNSIVTVEVTPSKIPQGIRKMIAERMDGINVVQLKSEETKRVKSELWDEQREEYVPNYIVACMPTFEALIEAIQKDEENYKAGVLGEISSVGR